MKLEPGKYLIEVSADDYKTKMEWVELEAGKNRHISVGLSKVTSISAWLRTLVGFLVILGIAVGIWWLVSAPEEPWKPPPTVPENFLRPEQSPRWPNDYFQRGESYRRKKQYDFAIADYTKAIELNQKLYLAYTQRGLAYGKK
jgi:tetratricopeptide (TPR) repeat protein